MPYVVVKAWPIVLAVPAPSLAPVRIAVIVNEPETSSASGSVSSWSNSCVSEVLRVISAPEIKASVSLTAVISSLTPVMVITSSPVSAFLLSSSLIV